MIQACYDWVWKLSGYLIFVTAVLQIVPGEKDRKYIHFFTGLVLIIMIAAPVLKFFTSDDLFAQFQKQYDAMEAQVSDLLEGSAELNGVKEVWDTGTGQESNTSAEGGAASGIRVEEIRIGHDGETP